MDRSLEFQQHVSKFEIAILLVNAPSNRLRDLPPLVPVILDALPQCKPGLVTHVPL